MLRQFTISRDTFQLSKPFRISRGIKTAAEAVTVEISQDGHVGRGEGIPYSRYDETPDSAIAELETVRDLIEKGAGRREIQQGLRPGAARNALDCALWDLEAKQTGRSVASIIGQPPPAPVATAITLSLDHPDAMAAAAAEVRNVPLLKVKVNGEDPLALVRAVRAAAPEPRMIVDPNESWTVEQVHAFQHSLAELRVDLLEQPIPSECDEALGGLSPVVPIAADESVHTTEQVGKLVGRYQYINIKLDKTGGLTEALELAQAARSSGFGLMVGCMVSSSLSIAPAMLIAQHCSFVDLDGPLWLAADRVGGLQAQDGMLMPAHQGFWGDA